MREIKFRAWDNDVMLYNVWPVGDKLYDTNGGFWRSLRNPLMQYTGLKDKNGKEIYEGDSLQFVGCFFEVRFDRGAFYGNPLAANDIRGVLSCQSFPDARIIGNIYQNPELLTQEK